MTTQELQDFYESERISAKRNMIEADRQGNQTRAYQFFREMKNAEHMLTFLKEEA